MEATMVADIERNYSGTNFAVITVVMLAFLALGLIMYGTFQDVADDNVGDPQKQEALR
jgi:hypothetical protein